jgi:hypothetical protein
MLQKDCANSVVSARTIVFYLSSFEEPLRFGLACHVIVSSKTHHYCVRGLVKKYIYESLTNPLLRAYETTATHFAFLMLLRNNC